MQVTTRTSPVSTVVASMFDHATVTHPLPQQQKLRSKNKNFDAQKL